MPAILATWPFSRRGVEHAIPYIDNSLNAVVQGIREVELDPSVTSVGYGGLPNSSGTLQLDAALMKHDGSAGSVMALEGYRSAIPIARLVLEESQHTALAGAGAAQLAQRQGITPEPTGRLLTTHASNRYAEYCAGAIQPTLHLDGGLPHSDTVGMIVLDNIGDIVVGCATSGMEFKEPGRVGDSPVIGGGLYASEGGAAVASGDGDVMMRYCIAFLVVEKMREGMTANQACRYAMTRLHSNDSACQGAVCAMDMKGEIGASCTREGFVVVHWDGEVLREKDVAGIVGDKWKHSCV